jgi:predicted nucleic acid-binding protein
VVCLDSNVFISFLRGDEPHSDLCREVLSDAQRGSIRAVTSSLAVVETVHLSQPTAPENEIASVIRDLYTQRWLIIWNLDLPIALEASRLSRLYRGSRRSTPHDAVYVATAKAAKASRVFTVDSDFIKRFEANDEGVVVEWPRPWDRQQRLPL